MYCLSCNYEKPELGTRAIVGRPVCGRCVARAALRGSGAHGLPWYVRVFGRSVVVGECWEYMASRDPAGYGSPLMIEGRLVRPHRLVLEMTRPCWDEGQEVDHICHNRACVRPGHLRWVTHRENCRNRVKAAMSSEERRLRWNAYHRGYHIKNREKINARRRRKVS